MQPMPLLIDECVRRAVSHVFEQRKHLVNYVTKELGQSTPDQLVAEAADLSSLILVTYNYGHFKALLSVGRQITQQKISVMLDSSRSRDAATPRRIVVSVRQSNRSSSNTSRH